MCKICTTCGSIMNYDPYFDAEVCAKCGKMEREKRKSIEIVLGFKAGDKLYIADKETGKVYDFITDCIKAHVDNISVHGYLYGLYGKFWKPKEYNLKYLNKRYIFVKKSEASKWLKLEE